MLGPKLASLQKLVGKWASQDLEDERTFPPQGDHVLISDKNQGLYFPKFKVFSTFWLARFDKTKPLYD